MFTFNNIKTGVIITNGYSVTRSVGAILFYFARAFINPATAAEMYRINYVIRITNTVAVTVTQFP